MDDLEKYILSCGENFSKIERQTSYFVASGIFKLGKIDKKTGGYKGPAQELRFFQGKTPLEAIQKLYYEIKKHYGR